MHPRNNIVEIFSTFLEFAADRLRGWATDARLRRSMQNLIKQTPQETSANFWVLYWYNHLDNPRLGRLAKEHLTAYLQEPCYWASQKTFASFAISQYSLSDFFQIAIAQVDKVFKGFNPKSNFVLRNYASTIFSSIIRETLRQRHEVDISTDWGLLRKITQKRLVESLQATGLSAETISAYVTAWNCFKSIYVPKPASHTRQLTRPDHQTWEAIAIAYNSGHQPHINPQILETWLVNSAKAVRRYLYPNLTSLNAPIRSENSSTWLDNLLKTEQDTLISQIITQEEQQTRFAQQSEINTVLVAAVAQLDPQAQKILELYYTQGLTQQQIAKQLQMQQYTVSRRLTKTRESLLRSLATWSQEKLHISVTSDILNNISELMEEWLQVYYSQSEEQIN
ncbi:MAG: sigma-70 family RNA polymerase sigma factor [Stigonema ocellatum SAG 48.90 = DSM 106950]|nr:sigma-70 family RNA polymerase sigma factor [Stigonema ocellatum SAG 48.90 = DSM 106950]